MPTETELSSSSTHVEAPEPIATSEAPAAAPAAAVVGTAEALPEVPLAELREKPTMSRADIEATARAIRADLNASAKPQMSEAEFAAWYQAFLTANSVLMLDGKTPTMRRGQLAEAAADEGLQAWRSKRMREGLAV